MVKGLYTAYTGMIEEMRRMDVMTNNLANASTTGFKKEGTVNQSFDAQLALRIKDSSDILPARKLGDVSLGVKVGETYRDYTQGSFYVTDNPYDVALDGEAAGESGKTVQRYVWLARLTDELLGMVDAKKIGITQGVDISFLSEEAQQWVFIILEETGASVSNAQAAKLKEFGKNGELTLAMVRLILSEEKPKERKVTLKSDKINKFFPEDYSSDDIEGIIIQLLEEWQSKQ